MKCSICGDAVTSATYVYVRDKGKKKIEVEICDYCRHALFAELAKQFVLEKWLPKM